MSPATLNAPETIDLMSVYPGHVVTIESFDEVIDPHFGKRRVPGTGKQIQFRDGRATIPADWMPLLEAHPSQLIQTGKVGRADEWGAIPTSSGPSLVDGAQATRVAATNRPPHAEWDSATGRQIQEWIDTRAVRDLEHAFAYEMANRRRKMVVRALTEAMLGDEPEPQPEPEPLAASFTAPIPSDGL